MFCSPLGISGVLGTQSLVFCVGPVFCSPLGISGVLGTQSCVFCVGLVFCSPLGISGVLGTHPEVNKTPGLHRKLKIDYQEPH
jgi:hypothetical protein